MRSGFLLYGSTGFVGDAIARLALQRGLRPILAGRNGAKVEAQAADMGLDYRVFNLDDPGAMDNALGEVVTVLHCAGPYVYTFRPMVDACLRAGTHYLDITGEIPVYEALAARDSEARARGIMLLPGVGFDVVPTDCLAMHLQRRLPSATRLTLAFHNQGPTGLPPGTANTAAEMIPYWNMRRRDGRLEFGPRAVKTRIVDFGEGPVEVTLVAWGDVCMAFYSTGIPNIEDYAVIPAEARRLIVAVNYLRPIFRLPAVMNVMKRIMRTRVRGLTPESLARTRAHVWGEVEDDQGRRAASRLHGPEAGVSWTSLTAVAAVQRVLSASPPPGFQTPSRAYGADFVLECEGVVREDLS